MKYGCSVPISRGSGTGLWHQWRGLTDVARGTSSAMFGALGVFVFRAYPLACAALVGAGVVGVISGINFLKLKAWACSVLEVLAWLTIVLVLGGMISVITLVLCAPGSRPFAFRVFFAVMGIVATGLHIVAVGIMLKYLRDPMVRSAMGRTGAGEAA